MVPACKALCINVLTVIQCHVVHSNGYIIYMIHVSITTILHPVLYNNSLLPTMITAAALNHCQSTRQLLKMVIIIQTKNEHVFL